MQQSVSLYFFADILIMNDQHQLLPAPENINEPMSIDMVLVIILISTLCLGIILDKVCGVLYRK